MTTSAETVPTPASELKPKTKLTGKVVKTTLAGVLVDLGMEIPGIIHISQLSATPVKRVEDVVQVGQEVEVWVRKAKADRVELTMIEPVGMDWRELKPELVLKGKVVRLETYGAFVEIGAERPGLVHISEMAHGYVKPPGDVVKEGDEIEAIKANKDNKGPQAPDVIDVGPAYGPLAKSDGLIAPYKVATWADIPDAQKEDTVGFLASLEAIEVEPDLRPKVVVSERTGTVVAGEGVKIRPVAVSHGGLQVRIQSTPVFSQPNAFGQGTTLQGTVDQAGASEGATGAVALPATTTIEELAKALSTLGAGPRDLIAVLEAMKSAGALDADPTLAAVGALQVLPLVLSALAARRAVDLRPGPPAPPDPAAVVSRDRASRRRWSRRKASISTLLPSSASWITLQPA